MQEPAFEDLDLELQAQVRTRYMDVCGFECNPVSQEAICLPTRGDSDVDSFKSHLAYQILHAQNGGAN